MVKISKVSYDKTQGSSRLEFNIEGDNIDYHIINTLRRIVLTEVPIYAYTQFKFNKNNSIFHNNFLKNQIKNMPVWGIENTIDFFEEVSKKDIENNEDVEEFEDNVDLNIEKKVDSTSLQQLTMYVDYENKSNDVETVTSDIAKFYFSQKQIENPYNTPIPIVKLQPNQKINFSVVTMIGIEKQSAIFSPVSICVYEQIKENEFRFIIESRGQISERRILEVALININKKLKDILNQMPENDKDEGEIQINNEDHTVGNLLSYGLQNSKKVKFAGYYMQHPLEKRVMIKYKLNSGKFKEILKDVIEDFINIFNKISKEIESTKF